MLHRKDLNVPSFEPSWSCCRPKSFKESCTHTSLSLHTTVKGHFTRPNFERWSYFYFSRLSEAASSVTKLQLKLRLQTGSMFKVVTLTCTSPSVLTLFPEKPTNSSSLSVRVGNMEIICGGISKLEQQLQQPFVWKETNTIYKTANERPAENNMNRKC